MIQLSDFYGYSMYTISSDTLSVSVMSLGATVTRLAYQGRNVVVSLKTPGLTICRTPATSARSSDAMPTALRAAASAERQDGADRAERGPQSPARWQRRLPQAHLGR